MRRVPIRLKLGATLLVPMVALVVVAGLEMMAASREVDEVHDQAELATATLGPPSLLNQLALERNAAATYLLGSEDAVALSVENNQAAWDATDASLDDFRTTVDERGGEVGDRYAPAFEALEGLDALRQQTDTYTGERSLENNLFAREVFDGYSRIMDTIYDANAVVTPTIADRELRRGAELADLSARQSDTTARLLRNLLQAQFEGDRDGVNTPEEVAPLARVLGELRRNVTTIDTKAQGPYQAMADELFATQHIQDYPELIQETLDTSVVDIGLALNTSTGDESGAFGYTVFSRQVNEQLLADAESLRDDADARFLRYGLLAGLAVFVALLTTFLVSRSLTRPLRSLTRQAKEMAGDRLPNAVRSILSTPLGDDVEVPRMAPVAIRTSDEVGDVAAALNTVQETALELAVEQAVLRRNIADSFVNLGRRNQNLLGRQLDFITELESNETNPDTLASLFRLDHLATRMRRNAESLLVLAGIDPPRRWAAPVRLNDVIRAALGEVEDYQRVAVLGLEPATVLGSAAADLAHLIAEFIENALTFSPPDQNVEIRGRHRPDGYTLAIIDNGFGMVPEDIERANRRLAGAESFTVAPSKYLGHYVAGNLAARHQVAVRLEQSPGSGVTAMVHLAPELLAAEAEPVTSAGRLSEPATAGVGANGASPGDGAEVGDRHLNGVALPGPDARKVNGTGHEAPGAPIHPLMPTLNAGPVPLAPGPVEIARSEFVPDDAGTGRPEPSPGEIAPGAGSGEFARSEFAAGDAGTDRPEPGEFGPGAFGPAGRGAFPDAGPGAGIPAAPVAPEALPAPPTLLGPPALPSRPAPTDGAGGPPAGTPGVAAGPGPVPADPGPGPAGATSPGGDVPAPPGQAPGDHGVSDDDTLPGGIPRVGGAPAGAYALSSPDAPGDDAPPAAGDRPPLAARTPGTNLPGGTAAGRAGGPTPAAGDRGRQDAAAPSPAGGLVPPSRQTAGGGLVPPGDPRGPRPPAPGTGTGPEAPGRPGADADDQQPGAEPLPGGPRRRPKSAAGGRTASGLTKRTPRPSADGTSPATPIPQGELLDTLSRHSRGGRRPTGPVGLSPAPPAPGSPPGTGGALDAPAPLSSRSIAARLRAGTAGTGAAGGPEGTGDAGRTGSSAWSALNLLSGASPRAPRAPGGPGRPVARPEAERTASGLTRRIPGAHLPADGPIIIRRGRGDSTPPPPPPPPGPMAPAQPGGDPGPAPDAAPRGQGGGQGRAESVYTLLTSFATGVQRGLDESASGLDEPEDAG